MFEGTSKMVMLNASDDQLKRNLAHVLEARDAHQPRIGHRPIVLRVRGALQRVRRCRS